MSLRVQVRRKGRKNLYLYYVDPLTGREVTKSAGTDDKGEANRAAQRWETELLESRGIDGCGWDYFRERFENDHLADKPQRSRNSYLNALDHFERCISLKSVAEVTADHVSAFKGRLLDEGRPVATVGKILTHCRAAFNWAEGIGMLRKCPKFTMPRQVKRKVMRGRAIGDAEFNRLLKHCHRTKYGKRAAPQFKRFCEMLRLSGLRLEEGSLLSWDAPPIQVFPDAKPHPYIVYHGETVKSREDELVPVTPAFAAWLRATPRRERRGLVAPVCGIKGEPLGWEAIGRAISEIGAAARVQVSDDGKTASAHDLRRAFGREWAQKVKPLILQRLMRHRRIETTMMFYAQLETEDVGAALWQVSRPESRKRGSPGSQRSRNPRKKQRS
jgi:integrase